MRLALVQLAVCDGQPRANVERAAALVAAAPPADLYLLPELWTTGYATEGWAHAADHETAAALDAMRAWAAARGAAVAGSLIARRDDGMLVNRLHVVGAPGADGAPGPEAAYDKAHLFAPMREPELLGAGTARVACAVAGARAALSICFDLRFPEMYRLDAADGAELFLVASAWPQARAEALRLFARARAAENQAWLALCNRTGTGDDGTRFGGGSCVVAPDGRVVADLGADEEVRCVTIDVGASAAARAAFPVLPLRAAAVDHPLADAAVGA